VISSPYSEPAAQELEAVVLGRVVAAGDHHRAVDRQRVRGEVQDRRRHHADVDHVGGAW
jgi:hypothetical protein